MPKVNGRYKMPTERRLIGGHSYRYLELGRTKKEAEKRESWWQAKGMFTRLAKLSYGWAVYGRSPKASDSVRRYTR